MSEQINQLLQSGEFVKEIPEPERHTAGWSYGNKFGEILNSSNVEGNSVVIDILPDGATEPVVIVNDIRLSVRSLYGQGRAVIWNTEQPDNELRVVDLDEKTPLILEKNDAYYYLNVGESGLLIRDDSIPAFEDGDEVMLNAIPKKGQSNGRRIEVPVSFLRGYDLAKKIRAAKLSDIDNLRPVLETWVRHRYSHEILQQEIIELQKEISNSVEGNNGSRQYYVAEDSQGQTIGVMGMQAPPYRGLEQFVTTPRPMEIINAYMAKDRRQAGVGRFLAKYIEGIAEKQGYTELFVNSGPRYQFTGWPFWTKLYGEPVGVAKEFYGPGGDAMVWRKPLGNDK